MQSILSVVWEKEIVACTSDTSAVCKVAPCPQQHSAGAFAPGMAREDGQHLDGVWAASFVSEQSQSA